SKSSVMAIVLLERIPQPFIATVKDAHAMIKHWARLVHTRFKATPRELSLSMTRSQACISYWSQTAKPLASWRCQQATEPYLNVKWHPQPIRRKQPRLFAKLSP